MIKDVCLIVWNFSVFVGFLFFLVNLYLLIIGLFVARDFNRKKIITLRILKIILDTKLFRTRAQDFEKELMCTLKCY